MSIGKISLKAFIVLAGLLLMLTFGAYNCRINTVTLPVAKTGQTESYKDFDNGHYQKGVSWPDPRFTDNGDGTVTDNLTGLMWMKDANFIVACCPECEFVAAIPEEQGAVLWNEALDIVSGINNGTYSKCSAGYNDWRLPNIKELLSLIDFSQCAPPLPSGHPFDNVQKWNYWSSTTSACFNDTAWRVDMYRGLVSETTTHHNYVWPVRGGQ
jgi:hypothetical protein